jgi:hypothetical protein
MKVIKEPNGELRCPNTLELLGHWFTVDNTTYYYERSR